MGDLIDFSDESPAMDQNGAKELHELKQEVKAGQEPSALDLLSRKAPPPRPKKPMALRGAPSDVPAAQPNSGGRNPPPPPGPRRAITGVIPGQMPKGPHPLIHVNNASEQGYPSAPSSREPTPQPRLRDETSRSSSPASSTSAKAPPPPPRRRGTPTGNLNLSPRVVPASSSAVVPPLPARRGTGASLDSLEPLPPSASAAATASAAQQQQAAATTVNKKVEIWRRRLARAHEALDQQGVALYTWRRGDDVVLEAVGIVREAMRALQAQGRGPRGRGPG